MIIACLVAEKTLATRHRFALRHVIHVNGTRGKSGVTRLIAAGLSAGGVKVYCKTTGTLPMIINTAGEEKEIERFGKANIVEQIKTLRDAHKDGAEVLVVECMAVDPELQYVCQHKILKADIGVITNARVDHVAEMGSTVPEVCDALCNTVPQDGILFTSDEDCFEQMKQRAEALGSKAVLSNNYDFNKEDYLFPENIALALDACEAAGVDRQTALKGMADVIADPYEAACFTLPSGASFINGMSANDPVSTAMVYDRFKHLRSDDGKLIIIQNCRPDRGYRTELMNDYIASTSAGEIWLMGRGSAAAKRKLAAKSVGATRYKDASDLPLDKTGPGDIVYAIGNIANDGIKLMDIVEGKEEERCTDK